MTVSLILYIVAAVLFTLAAFGVGGGRINLIALGLTLFTIAHIT